MCFRYCILVLGFWVAGSFQALAHGDHMALGMHAVPAAIEASRVTITEEGGYRYIESNGIPRHETGQFPNRRNPNAISAQRYSYRVPLNPQRNRQSRDMRGYVFGVALNGVPFDPGTAETWNGNPEWRQEALVGILDLGTDGSNAHVQPTGAYHYHGIPWGMLTGFAHEGDLMLAGYAADGFAIYMPTGRGRGPRSSYQLRSGMRNYGPNAPSGRHDGTYAQDYDYIDNLSPLDPCNGMMMDGVYGYVLTEDYPFVPRCFMGTPDASFSHFGVGRGPGPGGPAGGGRRGGGRNFPPPVFGR